MNNTLRYTITNTPVTQLQHAAILSFDLLKYYVSTYKGCITMLNQTAAIYRTEPAVFRNQT